MSPFADKVLRQRYDVTYGATTYYGSTTAGEMRELCHSREPYQSLVEGAKINCLPQEMEAKNYRTGAMHNFTSAFFGRSECYPRLGFEKQLFSQDFGRDFARKCGDPFRGPCDVDLVPIIRDEFKTAIKPTLMDWMTLSTQVPIMPGEGTPRLGCDNGGGRIGRAEVCSMTELWMDLFDRVVQLTAEVPPMEILLVGNHAPPLWSKAGRRLFSAAGMLIGTLVSLALLFAPRTALPTRLVVGSAPTSRAFGAPATWCSRGRRRSPMTGRRTTPCSGRRIIPRATSRGAIRRSCSW